ncbi:hypothetical protein [Nonomuraea sediminis]|uniref:hypothetical protein n=1 Tax=Nonomuraea sediminis TaxID=2835864 RepID=UPI001BDDB1BF|nr:hypothetical protein [Nonomuraea sediminis]
MAIQVVLLLWWAALYPGLFSRDSVLYLSHTVAGPWISDHSVLYDSLLWLSFRFTGDIALVTLLQTTAMAAAITVLAEALKAMGAPKRWTTGLAVLLPFLPPVGAFSVALWKDVPFSICALLIAAVCARIAADRSVTRLRLVALGLLFTALGLFRANGFLVVILAVIVLLVVLKEQRILLAVVGVAASAIPLMLNNLVFPHVGIAAPTKTYVYHTAFGDIAVAFAEHPELFDDRDTTLLASVAPLNRWTKGGTCYTINPLIWRANFSWQQADAHAGELLDLWRRLLIKDPGEVIKARLCRGSIAWKLAEDESAMGGDTYRFSLLPNADTYVGPGKVTDFPGRAVVYSLRPLSDNLHQVVRSWLDLWLVKSVDWLAWRGALWSYLSYLAVALAAWSLRNRYVVGVAAIVAGQQLAILANISAQDYRYMASPIFIGFLLLPLLVSGAWRLGTARRTELEPQTAAS